MKLKPITADQVTDIIDANGHIRKAIQLLHKGGALKAMLRVQSVLKSVEGAERHAKRRWAETKRSI